MRDPASTLPAAELEERIAIAFLEQFVADRAAGEERPLAHYLARFGRAEARIAAEWLRLCGRPAPAPSPAPTTAAAEQIGPYRLRRELGRGAQGVVYLAEDSRLPRQVALKVLGRDGMPGAQSGLLRLRREAEAIARLDHPGIATIYETGFDAATPWLAMRYVAGGTLQQAIARQRDEGQGPPRTRDAIGTVARLVERAARALAVAHDAGILHRDIKPGNLLLAGPEEPVLVDFGLATDERANTPTITAPGAVFGTLGYLAPERLAGAAADERADVYALGAVLFELLTLQRPYAADVTAHELHAIEHAPVPAVAARNAAVPRDLAVIVATAIAKAPRDRYATARAFADDLARFLARQPIAARPASPLLRLRRWAQRNRALAASLGALVLALAAGLTTTTWLWRQSAAALGDVKRLADLKLARELVGRAATLWPARPEQLAAMTAWRDDCAALRSRLPAHRDRLAALADEGADAAVAWEREQLAALLQVHEQLAAHDTAVAGRTATARGLRAATIDAVAADWAAARDRVAADPRFPGLQLTPQLGLVPLGPDPASGLEEFAHVLSGTVPQREPATRRLVLAPEHGIVLVLVPGGRSVLGADREPPVDGRPANVDPDVPAEQTPSYVVELAPFLVARHEMTQAQWQRHTGHDPATYRPDGGLTRIDSLLHPVELVTWEECDRVLRELDLCLPTEAQWEHAYRAGSNTPYPYGPTAQSLAGHENLADRTARDRGTNRRLRFVDWLDDGWFVHAPVGSFAANRFGLCDMGGNVKEWCLDSWEDYPAVAPRPGDGLRRGQYDEYRIVRGGSFSSHSDDARAAARGGVQKNTSGAEAGLRAARALQ